MARQPSEKQKQRIHEAADSLVTKGIDTPTNDQVLDEMGGGSIADVSPAMREWRKKRKQAEQMMFAMPETVKKSGLIFLSQMWGAANSEAQIKVDSAHSKATEKTLELEDELQTCLNSLVKIEESLANETKEKEALTTKLEDTTKEIKKLEKSSHRFEVDKETALARLEVSIENETVLRKQVAEFQKELIDIAKKGASKVTSKTNIKRKG